MKRAVYTLPLFILVLSIFVVPQVHAKQSIPAFYQNATSHGRWQGNQQGMSSKIWVDDPPLSNNEEWVRYMRLETSDGTHYAEMGIDVCGGNTGCTRCGHIGSAGIWLEVQSTGMSPVDCFSIDHSFVNTQVTLTIYVSSVDGSIEFLADKQGFPCYGNCSDYADPGHTYYYANEEESIKATWTGVKVWGGNWTYNTWLSTSGGWNYQTRDFDTQYDFNPPQFGFLECASAPSWCYLPAQGNHGGSNASCVYAGNGVCNWRS